MNALFFNVCFAVCTEGGVRLVGGSSRYVGRVEVCVNAVWGTVCADGVTQSDAESVCTKQGFSGDGERNRTHNTH